MIQYYISVSEKSTWEKYVSLCIRYLLWLLCAAAASTTKHWQQLLSTAAHPLGGIIANFTLHNSLNSKRVVHFLKWTVHFQVIIKSSTSTLVLPKQDNYLPYLLFSYSDMYTLYIIQTFSFKIFLHNLQFTASHPGPE